jgi:hypothetical protein
MAEASIKKVVNRMKTSARRRSGPVRKTQDATPIADAMRDSWRRGMLTFGIPADRRIMALVTFARGAAEIDRLVRALRDLVDGGFFAPARSVKAGDAAGLVSAELITPYPPGIPAVAPGELLHEDVIAYLQEIVGAGSFREGATDPALQEFRVVA